MPLVKTPKGEEELFVSEQGRMLQMHFLLAEGQVVTRIGVQCAWFSKWLHCV
jgi:hypothetical protein